MSARGVKGSGEGGGKGARKERRTREEGDGRNKGKEITESEGIEKGWKRG